MNANLHHDGNGLVQEVRQTPIAEPLKPADALRVILLVIGNVDHSKGNGERSAQMRGEMLNDIRELARKALGTKSA